MDAAHTGLPAVAQPDMFGAEAEEMPMEMDELAGPDAGASGEAGGPANLAGDVADDAGNEDEDADESEQPPSAPKKKMVKMESREKAADAWLTTCLQKAGQQVPTNQTLAIPVASRKQADLEAQAKAGKSLHAVYVTSVAEQWRLTPAQFQKRVDSLFKSVKLKGARHTIGITAEIRLSCLLEGVKKPTLKPALKETAEACAKALHTALKRLEVDCRRAGALCCTQ
jgi:hypothetical protein